MRKFILISLAIGLHGCYEGTEFRPVPIGGGGGDTPTYRSAPQQSVPPHPMIDDPDARTEDWEDDMFANSPEEAESKCRQKAENLTSGGALVRSLGAKHISGKLYKCQFVTEVYDANSN